MCEKKKKHDVFEWFGMISGIASTVIAVFALAYAIWSGSEQSLVIERQNSLLDSISGNTMLTNVVIDSNLVRTNSQLGTLYHINTSLQKQIVSIDSQLYAMKSLTHSLNRMIAGMNKMPYTTLYAILPGLDFRQFAMFNANDADIAYSLFNDGATVSTMANAYVYFPRGASLRVSPAPGLKMDTTGNESNSDLGSFYAVSFWNPQGPITVKQSQLTQLFTLHATKNRFPPEDRKDIKMLKKGLPLKSGLLNIRYTINDNERGYYGVRDVYLGHGYLRPAYVDSADVLVDKMNKKTVNKWSSRQNAIPEE